MEPRGRRVWAGREDWRGKERGREGGGELEGKRTGDRGRRMGSKKERKVKRGRGEKCWGEGKNWRGEVGEGKGGAGGSGEEELKERRRGEVGRGEGRWGRGKPGAGRGTGVEGGRGRGGRGRGAGADAGQLPGSGRRAPPPRGGSRRLLPCMVRGRGPPREPRPDRKPPSLPSRSRLPPRLGRETASFHDSEKSRFRNLDPPDSRQAKILVFEIQGAWKARVYSSAILFFFFSFIFTVLRFLNVLVLGLQKTKYEIPQY